VATTSRESSQFTHETITNDANCSSHLDVVPGPGRLVLVSEPTDGGDVLTRCIGAEESPCGRNIPILRLALSHT